MPRRCWTCQGEHNLDEPCSASMTVRSMRSAGQPGNTLADHTSPDLFDDAESAPRFGPVFTATYVGEDDCCGDGIGLGDEIRADGHGGWIHASEACERMARS